MIYHVYANRSNVGDWLSAQGIQSLLAPWEVHELFCDAPFVPETLARLAEARPSDFVIIGGGGLMMDYFAPFWEGFAELAPGLRYAIWGAGCCDMKLTPTRPPLSLVTTVIRGSELCVVRDALTREVFGGCEIPAPVVCPTVVSVLPQGGAQPLLLHVDHYDNVGADVYEQMVSVTERFAADTGRGYRQTNNLITAGRHDQLRRVLELYISADMVVSSRLHGVIIALATGRRVLAVSGDHKVESFMHAAGLSEWVIDPSQIAALEERLAALPTQRIPVEFVDEARAANRAVAARVKQIIDALPRRASS